MTKPRLTLLVNPTSGRGKAGRLLSWIVHRLKKGLPGVDILTYRTTSFADALARGHAAVAAAQHRLERGDVSPDKPDIIAVVGGDGMIHIGFNICAETGLPLGIIPAGTGNDFLRGLHIKPDLNQAIDAIISGSVRTIDLIEATGDNLINGVTPNPCHKAFVGSAISTGFDARVNRRANQMPISLGRLSYGYAILGELRSFRPDSYRVIVNGEKVEREAMICVVANAGVIGGGMKMCPSADVTDGKMDITMIDPVPVTTLLRHLPSLYTGDFVNLPFVHQMSATRVVIDGDGLYGMADGEELGPVPITATIKPGQLRLYAPSPNPTTSDCRCRLQR